MKRPTTKTTNLIVRVTKEQLRDVKRQAKALKVTQSQYVRWKLFGGP